MIDSSDEWCRRYLLIVLCANGKHRAKLYGLVKDKGLTNRIEYKGYVTRQKW